MFVREIRKNFEQAQEEESVIFLRGPRQSGKTTRRRYLALVQAVFFTMELPAWARNTTGRLVKQTKIHLCDTGVAAVLAELTEKNLLLQANLAGQMLESYVVSFTPQLHALPIAVLRGI